MRSGIAETDMPLLNFQERLFLLGTGDWGIGD
jgi:hypothetical protein